MDENTILLTLLKLENMRLGMLKGTRHSTIDDHSIRMCQAEIASDFYSDRNEWVTILVRDYGLVY